MRAPGRMANRSCSRPAHAPVVHLIRLSFPSSTHRTREPALFIVCLSRSPSASSSHCFVRPMSPGDFDFGCFGEKEYVRDFDFASQSVMRGRLGVGVSSVPHNSCYVLHVFDGYSVRLYVRRKRRQNESR